MPKNNYFVAFFSFELVVTLCDKCKPSYTDGSELTVSSLLKPSIEARSQMPTTDDEQLTTLLSEGSFHLKKHILDILASYHLRF